MMMNFCYLTSKFVTFNAFPISSVPTILAGKSVIIYIGGRKENIL